MDTSNFELAFFGSEEAGPKLKKLSHEPKTQKTVYCLKVDTDSSDSDSAEEPCRCLDNCISCSGGEKENEKENESCSKPPPPQKESVPKHIKRSLDTLQSIKERVLNSDKLDDEFSHFGKNIASQLRQLPITEALNLQLQFLSMLKEKREAAQAAKLEKSSSSSYTTEYTFEIQNTVSKVGPFIEVPNKEETED